MSKNKNTVSTTSTGCKIYNIAGKLKLFVIISSLFIIATIVAAIVLKPEIAIEFKGGTIITYTYTGDLDTNTVKPEVEKILNTPVKIYQGDSLGNEIGTEATHTFSISYSYDSKLTDEIKNSITEAVKTAYPDNNIGDLADATDVSATSGREFFLKCFCALGLATILLIIYIAWRFKRISGWSAGVVAIMALVHDSIAVFATFVVCGFEIDSNFMAVVLTILGYSVNDTIVIYDRIRENRSLMPKASVAELLNISTSQSITRSLRTAITTIAAMSVVCILAMVYNLDSILSFAFPLIIGMISGTYSSVCLAPSVWAWWQQRKEKKN